MRRLSFLLLFLVPVLAFSGSEGAQPAEHWLVGQWQAEAFGGIVAEEWRQDAEGALVQRGVFIENGTDTTYTQWVKIERIGDQHYLIALPGSAPPQIYTATEFSEEAMVFENPAYENPFRVHYKSGAEGGFSRTVTGRVGGEERVTVMEFERQ